MLVRGYMESDLESLERWHARSGFAYNLPDLSDWRMNPKLVLEADGKPVMAAALRLTSEAYLWMDKEAGNARRRRHWLLCMHHEIRREAQRIGIQDTHAFLPPDLPEAFDRHLKKWGWTPEPWRCMWRPTA